MTKWKWMGQLILATALTTALSAAVNVLAAEPRDLRCEYRDNPLGIETSSPCLSWTINSENRGEVQTAYQVLVASSLELLSQGKADFWDSGKVSSNEMVHVPYAGRQLGSSQRLFWKTRVWDKDGVPSAWSSPAEWTMGILKPEDWGGAKWIGARHQYVPLGMMITADHEDEVKAVLMDLGAHYSVDRITFHPQLYHDPETGSWIRGYGFPKRFRIELSDDASFAKAETIVDESGKDVPNPGLEPVSYDIKKKKGRYLNLTLLKHSGCKSKPGYCSALGELVVKSTPWNVSLGARVSADASVETEGWSASHLTDGLGQVSQMKRLAAVLPETSREEKPELKEHPQAAIYLRKEIDLSKPVRRAIVSMSGLGMSELIIEGEKVGDAVLSPEFSDFNKRVSYVVHDVTAQLQTGNNAIGVILGNGIACAPNLGYMHWYGNGGQPRLLFKMELEFTDGTQETVLSDESWKWSTGEITYNDNWVGEHIDHRLTKTGWDCRGFKDSGWYSPELVSAPQGKLFARMVAPIRVLETEKASRIEGNSFIFDTLGAGWFRLKTEGKAGDKVVVNFRPGQSTNYAKGGVTLGFGVTTEFTLKGGGEEVFEPKFLFNTLEPKVTVEGLQKPATPDTLTRCSSQIDLRRTGNFECSNPFLNRQYEILLRTQRNYNFDYPMDPTREKSGWTQDVMTMIDSSVYYFDSALFYWNWWQDMRDNQEPNGYLGSVVPLINQKLSTFNCVWWSGMIIYTPWKLYQYYGDKRFLEESYPAMVSYLQWLGSKADKDKVITWGLGDCGEVGCHGKPERTSTAITSTCGYYLYAGILAQSATILGKVEDAVLYEKLAADIRDGFLRRLFNPETGQVGENPDSQTACIMPLNLDMIPPNKRSLVIDRLVANIHERNDHISSGFVGNIHMLLGLPDLGYQDLTYKMVTQMDFPGWNTLVKNGVQMEAWEGNKVQMPSLGGPIGAYLYQILGGIRPDPSAPGFKKIIVKPSVVGGLTWVKSHYDSIQGTIRSDWNREGNTLAMDIDIPANTTATVFVPAKDASSVTESGKSANKAEGVKFLRMVNNAAVYAVGSGQYHFTAQNP